MKIKRNRRIAKECRQNAGGLCARCGAASDALEADHKLPLWMGGQDVAENLQALCPSCHAQKGKDDRKAARIRAKHSRSGVVRRSRLYRGVDGKVRER